MTTAFIGGRAVVLPNIVEAGMPMTDTHAALLTGIWLKRLSSKLRWLLDRGQIDAQGVQIKALELATEDLAPYNIAEDADEDDPVLVEALAMAEAVINSRMAAEGLPPPRNIDQHARALVAAMPALVEKARLRVEARYQAAVLPEA
jgi:hypothetical protein